MIAPKCALPKMTWCSPNTIFVVNMKLVCMHRSPYHLVFSTPPLFTHRWQYQCVPENFKMCHYLHLYPTTCCWRDVMGPVLCCYVMRPVSFSLYINGSCFPLLPLPPSTNINMCITVILSKLQNDQLFINCFWIKIVLGSFGICSLCF